MNEEEEKAVEDLRKTIDYYNSKFKENEKITTVLIDNFDVNNLFILLNLIQNQKAEIEKKEKMIDLMAEEISNSILNTCPLADYDVDLDCENKCKDDYKACWKKYFERKVENGN